MRIKVEEIQKREQFITDLFKSVPGMSADEANDKLKERFGSKMRPGRVYELRKISRGEQPKLQVAFQAAKLSTVEFVRGNPQEIQNALETLKKVGLEPGIKVEAVGQDYVVIRKTTTNNGG